MLPLLPERSARIVDLGCGTGTWTRLLVARFPSCTALGVDSSQRMVDFALRLHLSRTEFRVADCCHPIEAGKADLVVCAMSADYIGFPCVAERLGEILDGDGVALVWVLDPSRYPVVGTRRQKEWMVGDGRLRVQVDPFEIEEVPDLFAESGLATATRSRAIHLSDGLPRRLICYEARIRDR